MTSDPDLKATLRAALAQGRDEMDAPTPEELIAYHEGLLAAAERASLERRLGAFPEAARALRDLARFPEVERPAGIAPVSEKELAAKWEEFLRRAEPKGESAKADGAAPAPRWMPPPAPGRRPVRWRLAAGLTAAAVASGTLGALMGRGPWRPVPKPQAGVELLQLAPEGTGAERGTAKGERPPAAGAPLFVVLELPARSAVVTYVIEIVGPPRSHWQGRAEPTALRTLQVTLPAGYLVPGSYRISVRAPNGGEVTRYQFEVE
jgi:hypothetical protein